MERTPTLQVTSPPPPLPMHALTFALDLFQSLVPVSAKSVTTLLHDCTRATHVKLGKPFCILVDEAQFLFAYSIPWDSSTTTTLLTAMLQAFSGNGAVYIAGTSLDFSALERIASSTVRSSDETRWDIQIWRRFAYHDAAVVKAYLQTFLALSDEQKWEPIFQQLAGRSRFWVSVLQRFLTNHDSTPPNMDAYLAGAVRDIEQDLKQLSLAEIALSYLAMLFNDEDSALPIRQQRAGVFFNNYTHGNWTPLTVEHIKEHQYRPGERLGMVRSI